jgi:hypothetical protein
VIERGDVVARARDGRESCEIFVSEDAALSIDGQHRKMQVGGLHQGAAGNDALGRHLMTLERGAWELKEDAVNDFWERFGKKECKQPPQLH